jgi:CSLREA domain-containing protein
MAGKMKLKLVAALVALPALLVPASAGAAAITPNTTDDEFDEIAPLGDCSLREAIQSANNNAAFGGCPAGDAGTDVITLTAGVGDPYETFIGAGGDQDNETGDFDLDGGGPILIVGTADQNITTLSPDRVFDLINNQANLTLRNVRVAEGSVISGGSSEEQRGGNIRMRNGSSLTLDDADIENGQAADGGGGIYATGDGQLTIANSEIEDNSDRRNGGGLFGISSGALTVVISNSEFDDNHVTTTEDGVGTMDGGAIWFSGAQMTISDSTFSDNSASHEGVNLPDGAAGGALHLAAPTTIRRSIFQRNTAEAVASANERGGAISGAGQNESETVSVINSTFDDNVAGDTDDNSGQGGAVWLGGDLDLVLSHVTFRDNQALGPEGDHLEGDSSGGTGIITLRNAIIPGGINIDPCVGDNIVSGGFNVAGLNDPDCGFGVTDSTGGVDIGLAAGLPQNNGGLTNTIALEAGGRAVDFIPAASCGPAESQDQRGFFRPSGGTCDAGAYERVTCAGVVQEGPAAIDCPPPPATQPTSTATKPKKKCKKKKKRKRGSAAAKKKKKKKCKKKKRKK